MKVISAIALGMCFGVRDALNVIHKIESPKSTAIYGELVHNEIVIAELNGRGFQQVAEASRDQIPSAPNILITAHGISDRRRAQLESAGKRLIDTTCPLVARAHRAARELAQANRFVVVIGRLGHVEVQGIVGDLEHFVVVSRPVDVRRYPSQKIGVIAQTTFPTDEATAIRQAIAACNPDADIAWVDTICQPTKDRQQALVDLLGVVDAVVVVGGSNSHNTQRLMETCRATGTPAFLVQTANQLRAEWFANCKTVGLTAGTSTLNETVEEVRQALQSLSPCSTESKASTTKQVFRKRINGSAEWIAHFRENVNKQLPIPWNADVLLADTERSILIPSLQIWQLGESGSGAHLLAAARRHVVKHGDPDQVVALSLFIAEEQRHGGLLGQFLRCVGAECIESTWVDNVFRRLRYLLRNMEIWTTVVLTAEILASIYYRAVLKATNSPVLKAICRQLLRDELYHLRFQCERLAIMHQDRSRWRRRATYFLQRVLLGGTALVVWFGHRRVFSSGGYTFVSYWNSVWDRMRLQRLRMQPEYYRPIPLEGGNVL